MRQRLRTAFALVLAFVWTGSLLAEEPFIPRRQDKLPGPPLSPEEAVKKMTVPEGFSVEVVASEPDIMNPTAMCFDERGRIWVCESFEYPRHSAGEGRDRVKCLEDTDGDGAVDKVTVFAEGLNIPCAIAVGHGGVWISNSPDILFLQDTDGDGKADKREVVVTGFGRADTHELPNSFTWGPDGWLYGLNGVFNPSRVEQNGKTFNFTCAMFRIHPRTREFQLFAEGTSNPWGIAFNHEGSAFISACVIDHLWHIAESAYYIRQGGPYPPFVKPMRSIVDHKHQMAAYCGITYFDSAAYPEKYRDKLYMGNIHGGCLNVDSIRRRGSSYWGTGEPDFLTANDVWFMPIAQKTGPDGCLYVLDWYDRYHCYQDANRDPAGIDRGHGRLYRVRYQDTPRRANFNLADASDAELVALLQSENVYDRDIAQRLLTERNKASTRPQLWELVFGSAPLKYRMHALFALAGTGKLEEAEHLQLLSREESPLRAWGVRAAGNIGEVSPAIAEKIAQLAKDEAPDVRLQVAIAARKVQGVDARAVLMDVATRMSDDPLLPHVVWQNLRPMLADDPGSLLAKIQESNGLANAGVAGLLPQIVEYVLATSRTRIDSVAGLLDLLVTSTDGPAANAARDTFAEVTRRVQSGELSSEQVSELAKHWNASFERLLETTDRKPVRAQDATLLAASLGNPKARTMLVDDLRDAASRNPAQALRMFRAIATSDSAETHEIIDWSLSQSDELPAEVQAGVIAELTRLSDPRVAEIVVTHYPRLSADLKPRAIELLTSRGTWAKRLLAAIEAEKVEASAVNVNQIRKLLASSDKDLASQAERLFGSVRTDRDPKREETIAQMRSLIRSRPGDAHAGIAVYKKLCAQCHKIYGEGFEVGPEITRNGRSSFEQLLSNVFDPSLVIGRDYQARTVLTADGRVISGLLVEDSPQRVVLKVQGGKDEIIPRDDVDDMSTSRLSLMPEGIEKQLSEQEIVDLFAFLILDHHPADEQATPIPGWELPERKQTNNPSEFGGLLNYVAPGFSSNGSGEGGLLLLPEYKERVAVLRTHPLSRTSPAVLSRVVEIPEGRTAKLRMTVAPHEDNCDWQLIVRADGKVLHDSVIKKLDDGRMWREVEVDLSSLAGRSARLELLNKPNDWRGEFGYWGEVQVFVE